MYLALALVIIKGKIVLVKLVKIAVIIVWVKRSGMFYLLPTTNPL